MLALLIILNVKASCWMHMSVLERCDIDRGPQCVCAVLMREVAISIHTCTDGTTTTEIEALGGASKPECKHCPWVF